MKLYCRVKDRDVEVDIHSELCHELKVLGCRGCSRNPNPNYPQLHHRMPDGKLVLVAK